jgi:hypothetical protein
MLIKLSAIHTDDGGTPRDLRWRRDAQRQEVVFIQEAGQPLHPATPFQVWTLVLGLEAGWRVWASCAGCGVMGDLLIDPITPGLQWCSACGGAGPR